MWVFGFPTAALAWAAVLYDMTINTALRWGAYSESCCLLQWRAQGGRPTTPLPATVPAAPLPQPLFPLHVPILAWPLPCARRLCSKALAVCCIALACIFCVVLTLRTFAGILRLKVSQSHGVSVLPACLPANQPAMAGLFCQLLF
jgi:hypothetical protein